MIRDPSDGSVREKPSKGINLPANEINAIPAKTGSKEITSGLPLESTKDKVKLEKSREWLKNRRNSKLRDSENGG